MSRLIHQIFVVLALTAVSCLHRGAALPPAAEREDAGKDLATFREFWLAPAHVAPPTIDFEPRQVQAGGYVATITPLLPEDADWNQWPGGELRLFNNRAAYLFEVRIEGPGPVRWVPEQTWIALNGTSARVDAVSSPDALLIPLLGAALDQERYLVDGDLVERTRSAGPFRTAYLPSGQVEGPLAGIIAFPLPDPGAHVLGLDLIIEIVGPDGHATLVSAYD